MSPLVFLLNLHNLLFESEFVENIPKEVELLAQCLRVDDSFNLRHIRRLWACKEIRCLGRVQILEVGGQFFLDVGLVAALDANQNPSIWIDGDNPQRCVVIASRNRFVYSGSIKRRQTFPKRVFQNLLGWLEPPEEIEVDGTVNSDLNMSIVWNRSVDNVFFRGIKLDIWLASPTRRNH